MKKPIDDRHKVLIAFLNGEISKQKAAEILGCTTRTIRNYKKAFLEKGIDGLKDHRHSNNYKLTQDQKEKLVKVKSEDRWRSARNVRDKLKLSVHETTVWRIFQAEGWLEKILKELNQ